MLVRIEFSSTAPSEEIVDLKDFGYEVETEWSDLTYKQQCEITDSMAIQYDVMAGGDPLSYRDYTYLYQENYNDEELEILENKIS